MVEHDAEEVEKVAQKALAAIKRMLEGQAVTPSNVRNITGALRDIRELCGAQEGSSLRIFIEGDGEWAK